MNNDIRKIKGFNPSAVQSNFVKGNKIGDTEEETLFDDIC